MIARFILLSGCFVSTAHAAGDTTLIGGTSWVAWAAGLVCGIALMVMTTLDWRRLPADLRAWLKAQRRNAGWAALGIVSCAVLAFY